MKRIITFTTTVIVITLLLSLGCEKTDPISWPSAEDKESYEDVINAQNEAGDKLDDWFQTYDSLEAINKAKEYFDTNPAVSYSVINSQGIAVQYNNGIRGGILLNPKDDKSEVGEYSIPNPTPNYSHSLKSLVNKKKMILINPHYFERSYYTDQVYIITSGNIERAGFELNTFYKNAEATVDKFTELSDYGIIQIYSHGWAWPKQSNITDVYLLTGETVNEGTSKKYWDDLKGGNIPLMKIAGANKYLVSPKFISKYNDFSNDTVFFYGGFCYSFLGGWPDIVDDFADGAYLGFDWSVYTHRNANWSVNSLAKMSDTSLVSPMNLESWMNDPDVEKSYWNEKDDRTVHIHYTGDGNLTLWGSTSASIATLSSDGAPVSTPGEKDVFYAFKCMINSNLSPLEFIWDKGDGSSTESATNNGINLSWSTNGTYILNVKVKHNGNIIAEANAMVTIGSESNELVDFLKTCKTLFVELAPGNVVEGYPYTDINWVIYDNIVWNCLNFSGSDVSASGNITYTVEGHVSSNGEEVSFVVNQTGTSLVNIIDRELKMTVSNYPLHTYNPPGTFGGWAKYEVDPPGDIAYVTDFTGHMTFEGGQTYYLSYSNFNWSAVNRLEVTFQQE